MRRVAIAASVHLSSAGARDDGVLGVGTDRDEIERMQANLPNDPQSRNFTRHRQAASSIDNSDEPSQNQITALKS